MRDAVGWSVAGTMHVEDGLRKLRQMENTTGIWTMRCILLVERRFIVILDKNSGVSHVQLLRDVFVSQCHLLYVQFIVNDATVVVINAFRMRAA